ncbi:MAG: hypothetical protein ACI9LV_000318 [Candidatus Nanohaloarchaea archaeon]|jgi:hypothetical protein
MEVETREVENGTRIHVEADKEVAVVVYSNGEERIYLPDGSGSDSTYYVENTSSLIKTETGYSVVYPGKVDDMEVLG